MPETIVVTGFARTPMGSFQGALSGLSAVELGAAAIRAAYRRATQRSDEIGEVLMGCVLTAGLGQAPARQAALAAGLTEASAATTISKVCGSGMKAVMLAHDLIVANSADTVVAGGMESMSNAPYLLERVRGGLRMGHGQTLDHMFLDGLEDAYQTGRLMGAFAEDCASQFAFTRQAQDAFAAESLTRARRTIADGGFEAEIVTAVPPGKGTLPPVAIDEPPGKASLDKIATLKPAFRRDGTVTAANSSSIADGAAALVLTRAVEARRRGLPIRGVIRGHASHAQAPALFTTAPAGAIRKLLARIGWEVADVDLFEINEAFAVVTMATMRELDLPHDRVNVHGGACALGHPIGASGARILVTLLAALETYALKRGVAALCIGGGEATAVAVERLG